MRSGNNIHVQQHNTNMINEEWNETQNDASFVAFYNMHAVMFVLPNEMADVSIAELQWFILLSRLNHTGSHRPIDSHSKPYLYLEKKYWIWKKNYPACCNPTNYGESSCSSLIFGRLFRHAIEKGRDPILCIKKTRDPTRKRQFNENHKMDRQKYRWTDTLPGNGNKILYHFWREIVQIFEHNNNWRKLN